MTGRTTARRRPQRSGTASAISALGALGRSGGAAMFRGRRLQRTKSLQSRFRSAKVSGKRRNGGSTTKFRGKIRKLPESQQLTHGSDKTGFTYRISGRVSAKKMSFVSAKNIYRYVCSTRLAAPVGYQAVGLLGVDGNGGTGNVKAGIYNQNDLANMKSYTQYASAGSTVVQGLNSVQFAVPDGEAEYLLTNSSTGNQIMWIYDLVPRKNIYSTDTAWLNPMAAWSFGYQQQASAASPTAAWYNNVGAKPFESKIFCETYKVLKVQKVTMAPGAMHRHVVRSTQRRWVTDSEWNNLQTGATPSSVCAFIGKRTVLTMVVFFGQPAHSAANADAAHVSTGACAIDSVAFKKYTYLYSVTGAKQTTLYDLIPQPTDLETVPEATGVFVPIVAT